MKKLQSIPLSLIPVFLCGCGTTQSLLADLPEDLYGNPQQLTYDAIKVEIRMPAENQLLVDVDGRGQATKDGLKMMAAAPVGCMSGGMFAAVCYGLMPFFPLIAAARAEDTTVIHSNLEDFNTHVQAYGLGKQLQDRVVQYIESERLPLASAMTGESEINVITLNVAVHALDLAHSGYKNGGITITFKYVFELLDRSGEVLSRRRNAASLYFSGDYASTEISQDLDSYLDRIVEQNIQDLLLEWRPGVRLGFVTPAKISKRNIIGLRYFEWAPVDSVTPHLAWQDLDDKLTSAERANISGLTYEIEIYGYAHYVYPMPARRIVIANIRDLPTPGYTVETPLLPCQRYYWKPRARFISAGIVRVVSAAEQFVLLTSGPNCDQPAWLLPPQGDEPRPTAEQPLPATRT